MVLGKVYDGLLQVTEKQRSNVNTHFMSTIVIDPLVSIFNAMSVQVHSL